MDNTPLSGLPPVNEDKSLDDFSDLKKVPPTPPAYKPVNFTEYTAFSNPTTGGSIGAPPPQNIPEQRSITSNIQPIPLAGAPKKRSLWWVWLIIGVVVLAGVLGGGYYAYSQGMISLPFLPVPVKAIMEKMTDAEKKIQTAEYSIAVSMRTEAREAGVKPLPAVSNSNINRALDSYLGGFGTAESLDNTLANLNYTAVLGLAGEMKKSLAESNGLVTLSANSNGEPTLTLEVRKIGESLYILLSKLPAIGELDLSSMTGKWIAITPENTGGLLDSILANINTNTSLSEEKIEAMQAKIIKTGFITLKNLKAETIGGVDCSHYAISLKAEKMPEVLRIIMVEAPEIGISAVDINSTLTDFQKPEQIAILKAILDSTTIEIWLEKDGLMRQSRIYSAIVPPEGTAGFDGKQITLDMTMTLGQVNAPIVVEVPTSTVSIMDLFSEFSSAIGDSMIPLDSGSNSNISVNGNNNESFDISGDTLPATAAARDSLLKSDLGQFRTALTLYADDNSGEYPPNTTAGKAEGLSTTIYDEYLADYMSPIVGDSLYLASDDSTGFVIYAQLEATDQYYWINSSGDIGVSATVPTQVMIVSPNDSDTEQPADVDTDSDSDGLTDVEEDYYMTDPDIADTDGDGYSDGQEVDGGYDPLVKYTPST